MKKKLNNLDLIVIGGNRLNEEQPFKSIIELKKKYNLNLIILTESIHLKKKINNDFKNFEQFLKKKKEKYINIKNYRHLFKEIKKLEKKRGKRIYLLVNSIFIIKKDIIKLIKNKIFNLHLGKLPQQRGAGISSWQILSNDLYTGITIHQVELGLDNGKILIQKKIKFKKLTKPLDIYKKIFRIENKALESFIKKILNLKNIKYIKQINNQSIYMPRLETQTHGYINWAWRSTDLVKFINAFDAPFDGARTFLILKGKHLKCIIRNAELTKIKSFHPFQSGIIFRKTGNHYYIACDGGAIKANLKLLVNYTIKNLLGKRLYTPPDLLDLALRSSSIHTAKKIVIK